MASGGSPPSNVGRALQTGGLAANTELADMSALGVFKSE